MERDEQEGPPSLEAILARSDHPDPWPLVTAEKVALLHLADCHEQLVRSRQVPIRLIQAAKSVHLALQAALTAALSGSMGIGALSEKDGIERLAYLQGEGPQPTRRRRVMSLGRLLAKARKENLEFTNSPLIVSDGAFANGLKRAG